MKTLIFAGIFALTVQAARAKPAYNCFLNPNSQVYGYLKEMKPGCVNEQLAAQGLREITCLEDAFCEIYDDKGKPWFKGATDTQIQGLINTGFLQRAQLVCPGTATVKDGEIDKANCPSATACQALFMFSKPVAQTTPTTQEVIVTPGSETSK